MDPLSDVLRAVRLTGAYFYMVEATHPWSTLTVEATKLVPRVHPAAEHLISYHVLTSGSCSIPCSRRCPGDWSRAGSPAIGSLNFHDM